VTICGTGRICGADLNGANLRIYRAYLRISDQCRVRVGVRIRDWVWVRGRARVRVRIKDRLGSGLRLGLQIVVYKLLEKATKCGSIT